MLEELYEMDGRLSEDGYYDALLYLLGDAYPALEEDELEDLLEDLLDQLPEAHAENVMRTVGDMGKKFSSGALQFANRNPGLVKGALTTAGTFIGGPIGAKIGNGLGNMLTRQGPPMPATGRVLGMMQDPQAQAAMARATLGVGNSSAPFLSQGSAIQMPVAIYLRAIMISAQAALMELDKLAPAPMLTEDLPYADDVDEQAEWLVEQLLGEDYPVPSERSDTFLNCDLTIDMNGMVQGKLMYKQVGSTVEAAGALNSVKAIVLHRTAGYTVSGGTQNEDGIGAHFYVEGASAPKMDGRVFQSVSLKKYTNHIRKKADKTRINNSKFGHLDSQNTIGIEVVGMVYTKEDGQITTYTGKQMPSSTQLSKGFIDTDGVKHYWDPLTLNQINSVVCLVKLLMKQYNLSPSQIVVHEELQKKTPGEGQVVKDAVFEAIMSEIQGVEKTQPYYEPLPFRPAVNDATKVVIPYPY